MWFCKQLRSLVLYGSFQTHLIKIERTLLNCMCKGLKLGLMGVREIVTPLLTMESIIFRTTDFWKNYVQAMLIIIEFELFLHRLYLHPLELVSPLHAQSVYTWSEVVHFP
jgi:hypothetical protein